jgi:hypothetical protein
MKIIVNKEVILGYIYSLEILVMKLWMWGMITANKDIFCCKYSLVASEKY